MKILSYKPINKGFVQGTASIETPSGLQIREITIFDKNGAHWISFPSRKYQQEGKDKYFSFLYLEAEKMKRFQEQFFRALEEWIKANPILAPQEHQQNLEEELPF